MYRLYEDRPDESIEKCALLLDEPSLDTAIRVGDVYSMMIEHYAHTGNHQKVCWYIVKYTQIDRQRGNNNYIAVGLFTDGRDEGTDPISQYGILC